MPSTLIVVVYRTSRLDLSAVPAGTRIRIVHNDRTLTEDAVGGTDVEHIYPESNLGFGAGVNLAARDVLDGRLVLWNPDAALMIEHWTTLTAALEHEVVTIPLFDEHNVRTSVVSPYPTPLSLLASGFRIGRFFPRSGIIRRLSRLLPGFGGTLESLRHSDAGEWALRSHWPSGAAVSVDASRFAAVGGFDESYFLYYEDVDLFQRMSQRFPEMTVRMSPPAAMHAVGGSAAGDRHRVERIRCESARTYALSRTTLPWRIVASALWLRLRWLCRMEQRAGA